jgi:hypothetical protein
VSFEINSIDDTTDEPAEIAAFEVVASEGIAVGSQPTLLLTILDNDLPSISFEHAAINVSEGEVTTISLVLSSASPVTQTVTIGFEHGPGLHYPLDYNTSPAPHPMWKMSFSIPAGASEATFELNTKGDSFEEGDELVTYTIISASSGISLGGTLSLAVTIEDIEPCRAFFVLHPNPTQGQINIWTIPANEDKIIDGILYDPNGGMLATITGTLDEINYEFTAALTGKRRGIYIVKLVACGQELSFRVVKL